MNVRDPFDLHRSPAYLILRGTARQAAATVKQRVIEVGTQALESGKQAVEDMSSFSVPKNIPSFTDPQRATENNVWGASGITARSMNGHHGGVMGGVQNRVENFFEKNRDLPMYKDKPYSYASSRRQRPLWKRKGVFGIAVSLFLIVLYLLGFFGKDGGPTKDMKDSWSWLQRLEKGGTQADWLDRRERVKEAFTLSWDAYERYAWGKFSDHDRNKGYFLACLLTNLNRVRRIPSGFETRKANGPGWHGVDYSGCIRHFDIDEFDKQVVTCERMDVHQTRL
jgi:hypothetical protein